MIDKTTVSDFEINRYLGTWYEIARYDHSFERHLNGVKAHYSLKKDGKIKVLNSGYNSANENKYSEAIGKAKMPNPRRPSKIKVSFFWIFYADYYVLEIDPDYKWAIVGSSSDNYLWFLSRTPKITESTFDILMHKAKARGYDTDKLIIVDQSRHSLTH